MTAAGSRWTVFAALLFVAAPAVADQAAPEPGAPVNARVDRSAAAQASARVPESREFPMRKKRLTGSLAGTGMPLLEGRVRFETKRPDRVRNVPASLFEVEYATVPLRLGLAESASLNITAVRGRTGAGAMVYVFDRDTDWDLAGEAPIVFGEEDGVKVARIPISYRDVVGGQETPRSTELVLNEPKPGSLEYHFDEMWEVTLSYGGEQVSLALQHMGTILFLDVNASGAYERIFYPKREVLGLGSRFFQIEVDFSNEKLLMKEIDRKPVDAGHPAPDFEAAVWRSDRVFKLSEHKGEIVVLTFWTPLCPGSKAEAPLYHALAKSFSGDARVRFVAVSKDAPTLEAYLKDHEHAFTHVVDPALWDTYGVTAPFVTFVIDGRGTIVTRQFQAGFKGGLEEQLRALVAHERSARAEPAR